LVTSNLPFDQWTSVFGSERLTGALLDRLTHHVHINEMNGDSFRRSLQAPVATSPVRAAAGCRLSGIKRDKQQSRRSAALLLVSVLHFKQRNQWPVVAPVRHEISYHSNHSPLQNQTTMHFASLRKEFSVAMKSRSLD
jgi:hypothetical protein